MQGNLNWRGGLFAGERGLLQVTTVQVCVQL